MGGQFGEQLAAGLQSFSQQFARGGTTTLPVKQSPAVQRVQQAVQQRVEAPIPQEVQFPTQAVGVPAQQPGAQAATEPAPAGAVPSVVPEQPAQAVPDLPAEREPTTDETLERVRKLSPTELAIFAAEPDQAANVQLGQLRQEEVKLTAKTAQQEVFNQQFLKLLGDDDQKQFGQGKAGLMLRSATVNPATGNISFNLGRPTSEEQRGAQRARLTGALIEDLRVGDRKPWQTVLALQADPDNPLTLAPDEIQQGLETLAGQLIAAQVGQGMDVGTAVENAFEQTGVIPEALEGFLPAAIINEARITHAKEVAKTQAQLSGPAEQLREVERANKAQEEITQSIIDFRKLEKPTAEQTKTRTAHLNAASALDKLVTNFDKAFVGVVRGRVDSNILDIFGGLKDGEQILRTQIAKLKVNTIQAITGAAMGETEAVRIMATIPDIRDTPTVFMQKLRQNAEERMDLLRIHEAIVAQGGRRFRGELATKEILIGDSKVTVIDVEPSLRIVDPSVGMSFNITGEAKAGIVVQRDGAVVKFDPETGQTKSVDTTGVATAPAGQTPTQAAAGAAPAGETGEISPQGQDVMRRIQERLKKRGPQ